MSSFSSSFPFSLVYCAMQTNHIQWNKEFKIRDQYIPGVIIEHCRLKHQTDQCLISMISLISTKKNLQDDKSFWHDYWRNDLFRVCQLYSAFDSIWDTFHWRIHGKHQRPVIHISIHDENHTWIYVSKMTSDQKPAPNIISMIQSYFQ